MNAEVVPRLAAALASRGVSLVYAPDGREALSYLLQRIPPGARVMNGGSATLEQIGFLDVLRGGRYAWLRPAIAAVEDRAERIRVRRQATTADWLVGGVNAITMGGEIVNVDGSGNRLAGYAFGAGRAILVAGLRKLALHTPCAVTGRCDNDACRGPERQCGKILIIENEKIADRMTVLLVGGSSFGY